jgi:eukaryotic-like serine/threonine-protein kinase
MSSGPNAPAPLIPGVELVEVIGSGGSGVVYRGRQAAFGRDVAVKVARNVEDADGAPVARWEREVAAVGRLSNHPNIVPVFDAGITDDGSPYLVMPHVPEGSLGDRIRAEGPMDPDEVASVGARLADALATVHAAGVLHRDIKPDNVLWSPHGEPQLTDFGIARLEDLTTTSDHQLQATISYAAPEVLAGEPATEATDVYGLGATLYACLTGSSPHPSTGGENVAALVARVLEEDPPPLAAQNVPAGLAAVIERAIARRPEDRHVDATRFRHELERVAAAPVTPVPPGPDATQRLDATAVAGPAADPPRRHVVAAPPARPEPPAPRPTPVPPSGGSNGLLWGGVAIVLVLAAGLVLLAGMRDEGDDTATEAPAETSTTPPPSTEASTTAAPTTTDPPTTTEAEPTTTAPADASPAAAGDPGEVALAYLTALDADELDRAWEMTTPRFQSRMDRGSWEAFWEGRDVDVVGDPRVDRDAGVVVVPLTYDGQREDYRLDVARQGGAWLIDGPVGN